MNMGLGTSGMRAARVFGNLRRLIGPLGTRKALPMLIWEIAKAPQKGERKSILVCQAGWQFTVCSLPSRSKVIIGKALGEEN
jgi:hypothetical protein